MSQGFCFVSGFGSSIACSVDAGVCSTASASCASAHGEITMLSIEDTSSSAQGKVFLVSIKLKIALIRSNMKIVGLSALSAIAAVMRVATRGTDTSSKHGPAGRER